MTHKPLSKINGKWKVVSQNNLIYHVLNVSDGTLAAIVAEEPLGWHLSISFRNHKGETSRYPKWDEQVHAVRALLPNDLTYASFIPPDSEFVALHDTTFHWHESPERT